MFIIIIVRFFIIFFINGWKYQKVATNWDRVTNWFIYVMSIFFFSIAHIKNEFSCVWFVRKKNVTQKPESLKKVYCWIVNLATIKLYPLYKPHG